MYFTDKTHFMYKIILRYQSLYLLFLCYLFCASCGNNGAETDSNKLSTTAPDSQVAAPAVKQSPQADSTQTSLKAAKTGYFYFELTPTKKLPFYFSQCIAITYSDAPDLHRKETAYIEKLKAAAKADGADLSFYNSQGSPEAATAAECTEDRKIAIRDLKTAGETVKEKNI